jgi:hypothetical protein
MCRFGIPSIAVTFLVVAMATAGQAADRPARASVQIETGSGPIVVRDDTRVLVIDRPRAAVTRIRLGDLHKRRGTELEVIDWSGTAGDMVITGQADQTLMGRAVWTAMGSVRLTPLPELNGWAAR